MARRRRKVLVAVHPVIMPDGFDYTMAHTGKQLPPILKQESQMIKVLILESKGKDYSSAKVDDTKKNHIRVRKVAAALKRGDESKRGKLSALRGSLASRARTLRMLYRDE